AFVAMSWRLYSATLFPYTSLFRSNWDPDRHLRWWWDPGRRRRWWWDPDRRLRLRGWDRRRRSGRRRRARPGHRCRDRSSGLDHRSEEHTSELQSRENLVCRLLLAN